jgi:hypothetical protein
MTDEKMLDSKQELDYKQQLLDDLEPIKVWICKVSQLSGEEL